MSTTGPQRELVFYYPNPYWHQGDWIKNLILFFDGIALLVPKYMQERVEQNDPAIVSGLRQHDLLHVIEPEVAVDKSATENLALALTDIITSGALDGLTKDGSAFHEISMSRLGWAGDSGLAEMITGELTARGLARASEDGVSIPLHPKVRYLVLVLLSQILRPYGAKLGAELSPATDQPRLVDTLEELLSIDASASEGSVVSFDMNAVGVDVSSVPLDEVLDFRNQNYARLQQYRGNVRLFAAELSALPAAAREASYRERQDELDALSADLRKVSRQAWRKPASFALSLMGAGWSALSGNPIGAVLSISAATLGYSAVAAPKLGAYSYTFRAADRFRY
jgi:hypothetical protein